MLDFIQKHLAGVDGVVFDYGGVIVATPGDDWPVFELCERYGLSRQAIRSGNARYRPPADNGDMSLPDMYRAILRDAGIPEPYPGFADEAAELDSEGYSHFRTDTIGLMEELHGCGKRLGLLSNMSQFYYENYYLARAGFARRLFHAETVSWSLHLSKPGRQIYDIASRSMGIAPQRLLFLDDTPANVEAARSFGWRAEVYGAKMA